MSTPNFKIEHRCIVVTDDDYEMGNVPEIGDSINNDINYPSSELKGYSDDLLYFVIAITSGYYSDSNIDYVEMEGGNYDYSIDERLTGCVDNFDSKKEWFDELMYRLASYEVGKKVSRWKIEKICRGVKLYDCPEVVDKYLKEMEEPICDKILDQIKKSYGYEEYGCTCVFSNGEAIYHKVG